MDPFASTQISLPSTQQGHVGHLGKTLTLAVSCLVVTGLAHLLLSSHAANRRHYTCAICRLSRVDYTSELTGRTRSACSESSCSRWYRTNIEPHHHHIWICSSTVGMVNFYGQTIGVGGHDERPGRVIWRLSPDEQIELYKHFDSPVQAKTLFTSLAHPRALVDRNDFSILDSLRRWADSHFQGQWHDPTASNK